MPRFSRLLPKLGDQYSHMVISIVPSADSGIQEELASDSYSGHPKVVHFLQEDRRAGRYSALKAACEIGADYIHYIDLDRLLHWVETQPVEWEEAIKELVKTDCIIFGRTENAFSTHPQSLITTEMVSNLVVSKILGREMDVSAGSKGFSRRAAEYIVAHSHDDNSIGSDAEWPILMDKAGFDMRYIQVDGLEWESADQYREHAVQGDDQAQAARDYDADPNHWKQRVEIAHEIIQTAFQVSQAQHPRISTAVDVKVEFDFEAVFDVDDYMYFYSEDLTDERTEREVNALVSLLKLDRPMNILDLACGFGRHTNRLAVMGHHMTGIDISPGFLEIARQDAIQRGVEVDYQQGDMRNLHIHTKFDVVLLLFTAFGYFSDEENLQVLINVRNALVPGGQLIFDSMNRDTYLKYQPASYVVEKEGNMMIDRLSLDSLRGRSINKRVVYRDGVRKDKPSSVRIYNPSEIQALIQQAGMEVSGLYGGWDAQEVNQDARRLVVVARKPY